MSKFMGQRGLVFALTALVMLVFGVFLQGSPAFPTVNGTDFTPEYIFQLIGGIIAPLFLLVKAFTSLSGAITARVNDPNDKFQASDFTSLIGSKEFWVYAVTAIVGIGQIFGLKVMDEETQMTVVNGLMAMATFLLQSWRTRPSGTSDLA